MSNQVCLMELPQDILKKFVRNFKMSMVNKECYPASCGKPETT